ncbi:MAG: helix-turn-helix domain-containing protein [FCB group bacterium]|nr:helix-turn-helix domain-containing protein [FCB group bacterium]
MENLLTPQEMTDVLGIAVSTIYQWTHQEYIPHIKIGKFVRFRKSVVEKWLEKREKKGRLTKGINIHI